MVKKGTIHFPVSFFLFSRCEPEKGNLLFPTMKSLQRRFSGNHFITGAAQLPGQSRFSGRPPSFSNPEHDECIGCKREGQRLPQITTQTQNNHSLNRTPSHDSAETALIKTGLHRRSSQSQRVGHDARRQNHDARAEIACESAGLFQSRRRQLQGREDNEYFEPGIGVPRPFDRSGVQIGRSRKAGNHMLLALRQEHTPGTLKNSCERQEEAVKNPGRIYKVSGWPLKRYPTHGSVVMYSGFSGFSSSFLRRFLMKTRR